MKLPDLCEFCSPRGRHDSQPNSLRCESQDDGLLSLFDRATWVGTTAVDSDEAGGSGEGREEKAETFVAQARLLDRKSVV